MKRGIAGPEPVGWRGANEHSRASAYCAGIPGVISGGCPTIAVSNFDEAIAFYTDVLGLTLNMRFGNQWAVLDAGGGLLIALIPKVDEHAPGAAIGLGVDEPFDGVLEVLRQRGVAFGTQIVEDRHVKVANFSDPEGNPLYLTSSPPVSSNPASVQHEYRPFFEYLGLRWNTLDGQRMSVEMDMRDDLCGPAGILQGGITATLVDVAAASTAALSGTDLVATTEMTLHYLAPGRTGPIKAVGELLRSGARSFAVEVRVTDVGADDRLMAVALAAFVNFAGPE
jgi:uncharacterized protein (TIGR00369 family)